MPFSRAMTRISYIVPIFNKARYLPSVVAAIDGQTGSFEREIVAIDDGSTDDSAAILSRLAAKRVDFTVVTLDDRGPAVAINRAAKLASGDFLKFVDGDDLLLPNCTTLLLETFRDDDVVLAHGDCGDYRSEQLPHVPLVPATATRPAAVMPALDRLVRHIGLTMSGTMVRADAFRRVGGCDERVFVHDAPLFLRLGAIGRFAQVAAPVALMPRVDPERWSNRAQGQVLHDINAALHWFLRDHPDLPRKLRRIALRRAAGRAWHWARRREGAGPASRFFWLYALSLLPLPLPEAKLIGASLAAFAASGRVRVPPP